MGRLTYVQADQIDQAYRDGELKATDILLTDAVPAEVPRVAGLITFSPTTPNSHVAILSRNFGIPFYHESHPVTQAELQQSVGGIPMLRTTEGWGINRSASATVHFSLLEDPIPSTVTDAIETLKQPQALRFKPMARTGALTLNMDEVSPSDIDRVGGKAAHFSFLSRYGDESIPSPSLAITFDLWQDFHAATHGSGPDAPSMDCTSTGRGSGQRFGEGSNRCLGRNSHANQGSDLHDRSAKAPRGIVLFHSSANCVFAVPPTSKIRDNLPVRGFTIVSAAAWRMSSTRMNKGLVPAIHTKPRNAVSSGRLKKSLRASTMRMPIENATHRIEEPEVGMALLVHHSFPDEIEWANGVAVVQFTDYSGGAFNLRTELVTQVGAQSVTNPEDSSIPETVSVSYYSPSSGNPSRSLRFEARSSLLQVGKDHVMDWQRDYVNLHRQIERLTPLFARHASNRSQYTLDIEYKKVGPWTTHHQADPGITPTSDLNSAHPDSCWGGNSAAAFPRRSPRQRWGLCLPSPEIPVGPEVIQQGPRQSGSRRALMVDVTWHRVRGGSLESLSSGFSSWDHYVFRRSSRNNTPTLVDRWTEQIDGEEIRYEWNT